MFEFLFFVILYLGIGIIATKILVSYDKETVFYTEGDKVTCVVLWPVVLIGVIFLIFSHIIVKLVG